LRRVNEGGASGPTVRSVGSPAERPHRPSTARKQRLKKLWNGASKTKLKRGSYLARPEPIVLWQSLSVQSLSVQSLSVQSLSPYGRCLHTVAVERSSVRVARRLRPLAPERTELWLAPACCLLPRWCRRPNAQRERALPGTRLRR